MCKKQVGEWQTVASDLDLLCLLGIVCPNSISMSVSKIEYKSDYGIYAWALFARRA